MKAFKGFKEDMTCRGFKYAEGGVYKTDKANVTECGFHACRFILSTFSFYPPSSSVYHEVELDGEISHEDPTVLAATEIKIGKRLTIERLTNVAIDETLDKIAELEDGGSGSFNKVYTQIKHQVVTITSSFCAAIASGCNCVANATGFASVAWSRAIHCIACATGVHSVARATGWESIASNTGCYSLASASGRYSVACSTGSQSAASASGYGGVACATHTGCAAYATNCDGIACVTGYCSTAFAKGDGGVASATGIFTAASADHMSAIAVGWGKDSKVRGVLGSHIVLADWRVKNGRDVLLGAEMVRIDGIEFKENTWYVMRDGKITEVK